MRDREVVASIKAGDPAGLAEAYARYAASLYAYCASMLREPADAADAVQDTFLIAASGLRGLRDPDRLRPWLYTVARNVCMRKLRKDKLTARYAPVLGAPASPGDGSGFRSRRAGQVIDPSALADPAHVGDRAERAELQAFVHDAAAGLTVRDREILQLRLWHGLSTEETAAALGLSRGHASALFSRARAQLETSLGVLLVARSGRLECERLNSLLGDWDGQLTVLLRKRLSRHIEHCETCGQLRRRELVPAFLGLSPGAAITGAAAAEAALHGAQLPAGLQSRVLAAAAHAAGGHTAAAVSAGAGAQQAGAQPTGTAQAGTAQAGGAGTTTSGAAHPAVAHFARALGAVRNWRPLTARGQLTVLGAGAAAVTAAVLAIALHGGAGHGHLAGGGITSPSAAATGPGTAAPGTGTGPGGASHPGNGRSRGQGSGPGASGPGSAGSPTGTRAGSGGASLTSQPGGSLAGSGTPGNPGTGGGPSAGASPPPAGSAPSSAPPSSGGQSPSSPPSSPPPAPPSSTPPPPPTGTVSVSTGTVLLAAPLLNTTITLTASGGPVTWSIAQRPGLLGSVSVFPTSGKLAAGQSVHVSVSARALAGLLSTLTVSPGGSTVTVVVSLDL